MKVKILILCMFGINFLNGSAYIKESSTLTPEKLNTNRNENLERIADFTLRAKRLDFPALSLSEERSKKFALQYIANGKAEELDHLYIDLIGDTLNIEEFESRDGHIGIILMPKNRAVTHVIFYVHGGPDLTIFNPKELSLLSESEIEKNKLDSKDGYISKLSNLLYQKNRGFHILSIASELSKHGYAFVCLNFPKLNYRGNMQDSEYAEGVSEVNSAREKRGDAYGEIIDDVVLDQLKEFVPEVNKYFKIDKTKNIFWGHSFGGELGLRLLIKDSRFMEDNFNKVILAMPGIWSVDQADKDVENLEKVDEKLREIHGDEFSGLIGDRDNRVINKRMYEKLTTLQNIKIPVTFVAAKEDTACPEPLVKGLYRAYMFSRTNNADYILVDGVHGTYSPFGIVSTFNNAVFDDENFNDKPTRHLLVDERMNTPISESDYSSESFDDFLKQKKNYIKRCFQKFEQENLTLQNYPLYLNILLSFSTHTNQLFKGSSFNIEKTLRMHNEKEALDYFENAKFTLPSPDGLSDKFLIVEGKIQLAHVVTSYRYIAWLVVNALKNNHGHLELQNIQELDSSLTTLPEEAQNYFLEVARYYYNEKILKPYNEYDAFVGVIKGILGIEPN